MADLNVIGGSAAERRAHYQEARPVEGAVSSREENLEARAYAPPPTLTRKSFAEIESRALQMAGEQHETITRYCKNDVQRLLAFFASSKPHNALSLNEKTRLSGLLAAALFVDRVIIFDSTGNREIALSPVIHDMNKAMTVRPPEVPFLTTDEQKQYMISQLFARLSLDNFSVLELATEFDDLDKRPLRNGDITVTAEEVRAVLKRRLKTIEGHLKV
jgi:hypothetical protein